MVMTGTHEFLATTGVRLPIFQATMAGVSSPALAAAVSEAGGLGALG
ncbi:MAG: nitronate monooxygenase, partial [Acetobacter sp.]